MKTTLFGILLSLFGSAFAFANPVIVNKDQATREIRAVIGNGFRGQGQHCQVSLVNTAMGSEIWIAHDGQSSFTKYILHSASIVKTEGSLRKDVYPTDLYYEEVTPGAPLMSTYVNVKESHGFLYVAIHMGKYSDVCTNTSPAMGYGG